jgi:hypothetical protein
MTKSFNRLFRKTIFIIISVVVLGLAFYYFKNIYGWMEFRENTDTPEQFLSKTVNSKENYIKDSSRISLELKTLLLRHEHDDFFYSKEYFAGTDIIIDTIVYSPDFNKLAIVLLTKNPTSRQLMPTKNENYYYNATTYLGIRQKDTLSLSWLGPNFSNSTNRKELSKDIRQACFRTFVSKDTTEQYAQKYNLNDIRFWTSSEWKKIEEDKIKKNEFEEEKIKHPENVYGPSK